MPDLTGGLTTLGVAETPAPDPKLEALKAKDEAFRQAGLDLDKLDPSLVSKAFATLQRYAQTGDPQLAIEKRAKELADQRDKQRLEEERRQSRTARQPPAGSEEDEEIDLSELPPALVKLMEQMAERVQTLEGGIQKATSDEDAQRKEAVVMETWGRDYQELQRQYPVLAEKPAVDRALKVILSAHLATTDDADAHTQGYVLKVGPQALRVLAEGGRDLAQLLDAAGGLTEGGPKPPRKLDFGKMTDAEYEASLADHLGAQRRAS